MQKWQCPIYSGTLKSFVWSSIYVFVSLNCLYSFAVSLYQITVLITSKIIISNCGFYHRELQSCAWRVTGIITLSVPLKDLKRLYLLSSEVKKIPGLVAARLESFGVKKSKVSICLSILGSSILTFIFALLLFYRFFRGFWKIDSLRQIFNSNQGSC